MEQTLKAKWIDGGKEPQCEPNPKYPDGIDIDIAGGSDRTCETKLSYPALRIGHHLVTCRSCGLRVSVTTAGRPDDPRSVKVACKQLAN